MQINANLLILCGKPVKNQLFRIFGFIFFVPDSAPISDSIHKNPCYANNFDLICPETHEGVN